MYIAHSNIFFIKHCLQISLNKSQNLWVCGAIPYVKLLYSKKKLLICIIVIENELSYL